MCYGLCQYEDYQGECTQGSSKPVDSYCLSIEHENIKEKVEKIKDMQLEKLLLYKFEG